MATLCVIFDLDGTLVDSEGLCNQAFLDLLPEINESVQTLTHRYRGKKLAVILADIERRHEIELPADFERRYRRHVSELFAASLKPMPGAREMLEAVSYPRCIASSGPVVKIRQSLDITDLAGYFGDNIFSSYDVACWKPDPGLFLHAADQMGFDPECCVVVEDSEVGIEAGIAAGMQTLQYAPRCRFDELQVDGKFRHMSELPNLLRRLERFRLIC